MTSQINANLVDASYPVAGVDNSSQGFRDNFSAIKNNFSYAASEITTLQSSAAFLNADNNFGGYKIYDAEFKYNHKTTYNLGTVSGSVDVDRENGEYQYLTTSGNITLSFDNWPATTKLAFIDLEITLGSGSHTITYPGAVVLPTGFSNPTTAGTYIFRLMTHNAGTTIYLLDLSGVDRFGNIAIGTNTISSTDTDGAIILAPNGNGQLKVASVFVSSGTPQSLSGAGAISLLTDTTLLTTTGSNALTLANGTVGQEKTIVMVVNAGDGTLTPTTKIGFTTVTFNDVGDTVTLRYTSSGWVIKSYYGVTIA